MKKTIEIILILTLMILLVGCKGTDESKDSITENIEQSLKEISETEKTIIEAQRLYDEGKYDEARNYIETVIYPNGSEYSEEQQKRVNEISANLAEFYVPQELNLTKEEAVSIVINCDDVLNYDYGYNSYSDIEALTKEYMLGNKQGYRVEISIPDKYFPTLVGIYFIDSSNGDIYKSNDSDRFELLN